MYRNRARAAHKLQPQVPVQQQLQQPPIQQQPGFENQHQQPHSYNEEQAGWNGQGQQVPGTLHQQQQQPAAVPFFNPAQYQNGNQTQQTMEPSKINGTAGMNQNQYNGAGMADWQNWNQNNADQNHNHNQHYNLNNTQVAEVQAEYTENHEAQLQPEQQQQQLETAAPVEQQAVPEVTLDPSGQWYWDYHQQQWFPYYPPQQPPVDIQSPGEESIENITQGIQQLTTAAIAEDLSREPSQETQYTQQQYSHNQQHGQYQQEQVQQFVDQEQQQVHDHQQNLSQDNYQQHAGVQQHNFPEPQQSLHQFQNGQAYPQENYQQQETDPRRNSVASDVGSQMSERLRQDSQMSDTQGQDVWGQNTGHETAPHGQETSRFHQETQMVADQPGVVEPPVTSGSFGWVAPPLVTAEAAPPKTIAPPPMGFSSGLPGAPAPSDIAPPAAVINSVPFSPPEVIPISSAQFASPVNELVTQPGTFNISQPTTAVSAVRSEDPPPLVASTPPRDIAPPPPMAVHSSPVSMAPPPSIDPVPQAANPPSLGPPDLVDHRPNTSQPELVSDISNTSTPGSPHHQPLRSVPPPDMFASLPSGPEHAASPQSGPDLTSQSVIHAPHSSPSLVSHDQHYEFYSLAYSSSQQAPCNVQSGQGQGMPDVTGGQQGGAVGQGVSQPSLTNSVKAPDILRTESVPPTISSVPSSDRNLFMETGELMEEDAVRVSHEPPPPPLHSPHTGPPTFSQMSMMGAASLPPMVGGNEHYEQSGPPMMRLVVGESHSAPVQAPPQRLVEGDAAFSQQLPVSREVEGESHPAPSPGQQTYSTQPQQPREPLEGESEPLQARVVPGLQSPPSLGPTAALPSHHPPSLLSVQVPQPDHPAAHQSPAEARSEAAGSDRRDVDVMGGPPPTVRPAPLPTPGRDIAGEESQSGGGGGYRRDARDPYDSEDDRDRDSDSGDRRYGQNRNRRTVSPGARSGNHRPARIMERSYRSSTDREDGDRRYGGGRRDDDRRQKRGDRDRDHRSYYDRKEERRQREREEEEERRSHRDYRTRPIKREPFDGSSYYEEERPFRPSRPGSRSGSVYGEQENSFGYRNMSSQWAMMQQQAMLQQQYLQQQQMMAVNPLQFQLQTAVAEMEKALDTPSNVLIYKQHWDYYSKAPALLEKLKLEQPIMHHLLQHFRQNFWHLVEQQELQQQVGDQSIAKREGSVSATPSNNIVEAERPSSSQMGRKDSFGAQFLGSSGLEESSIRAEMEQYNSYTTEASGVYESAPVLPTRLTPLMFSRPHTCARISASGLLVKVEPNNPQEGQTATVELHSMAALLRDTKESQELAMFPGPLKPGVTHKNDVIKFCEKKIAASKSRRDMADKESYILLWDMLVLLLRQKGQVEGSDLAELLLKDSREIGGHVDRAGNRSRASSNREMEGGTTSSASSVLNEEVEPVYTVDRSVINHGPANDPVDKFRSYLLHGNKTEGLEFAMKAGLWGHALFLASKMDQRTYAGVMTRFANGLAINDPLQTLYQLMSARMPSSMKQCADQRWGDWRPHLAMILSNPLPGSDINHKSMITLGDSLLAKGQLYAAQFCYIVSAADWGTYSNKCAKLVLLLSSVADKSLEQFATTEAIQCTEIYEFVQKLGYKEFEMPYLQPYKYLHCLRLVEAGHSTAAQDYVRVLADYVINSVTSGHVIEQETVPGWVEHTAYLAEKLKYLDPVYTTSVGEIAEIADPEWLVKFREAVTSLQYGAGWSQGYEGGGYYEYQEQEQYEEGGGQAVVGEQESYPDNSSEQQPNYSQEPEAIPSEPVYSQPVAGFEHHPEENVQQPPGYDLQQLQGGYDQSLPSGYDQPPPGLSSQLGDQHIPEQSEVTAPPAFFNPSDISPNSAPTFFNPASLPSIPEQTSRKASISRQGSLTSPTGSIAAPPDVSRQNSLPRSRQTSESEHNPPNSYYGAIQKSTPPMPMPGKSPEKEKVVDTSKKASDAPAPKKSWFGGIFSKIIKSDQVHLPDDKDKKIVYDEAKKRWVNLDGEDDDLAPAAPPPMDPAFSAPAAGPGPALGPGPPTAPTSFRAGLGTRRGGRGYVDVLGQAGLSKPVSTPMLPNGVPPGGMLVSPPAMLNPNLAPISNDGPTSLATSNPYLVPDSGGGNDESSANAAPPSMPMMFNPSSMAGTEQPPGF